MPRYSTSLCGGNRRKANYISMICHYCASGVNGSILYDAKHASALAADEIVECKIIQGKESLSAIRKIPLKTHFSHTFVKKVHGLGVLNSECHPSGESLTLWLYTLPNVQSRRRSF